MIVVEIVLGTVIGLVMVVLLGWLFGAIDEYFGGRPGGVG